MSDCWKILGIERTNDKRAIRSAYAAQSKLCHMEENPEAFARLHQAYQEALKSVSGRQSRGTEAMPPQRSRRPETIPPQESRRPEMIPPQESRRQETVSPPENRKKETIPQQESREPEAIPILDDLESEIVSEQPESMEEPVSLLRRMQQAEESRVEESLAGGALKEFADTLAREKGLGKRQSAEVWKEFFLSDDFLREQFDEGFMRGMLYCLSERGEGCSIAFRVELAIAYALSSERAAQDIPYVRECMQGALPARELDKPENLVRLRSFDDYIRLCDLLKKDRLTTKNKDSWENLLMHGAVNHMFERWGKGSRDIYSETRSVCLIRLYIFWVREKDVPNCVLEHMYKQYALKDLEHSSSRGLYAPLKQEILSKYPNIEDALFGAASRTQTESDIYREIMEIVAVNHADYDRGIYQETEKTRERIRALFSRPDWQKQRFSNELFERLSLQFNNRMVVPESLARGLIAHFSQGIEEGRWEDAGKASLMVETLVMSLAFSRRIRDIRSANDAQSQSLEGTGIEDIRDDNRDFWYYYLAVGFGFRKAEVDLSAAYMSYLYTMGAVCYLPLYMRYNYYPARRWIKSFVEGTGKPPVYSFALPDGKRLEAEFHLHYCLYLLDGGTVYRPAYPFGAFVDMAEKLTRTEQFFFLLAITEIRPEDRTRAEELIKERLGKLMLFPATVRVLCQLLAGEEELLQASECGGRSSYQDGASASRQYIHPSEEKPVSPDICFADIEAIYYQEQEDHCFRVLVTKTAARLFHQRDFGWHELMMPEFTGDTERQARLFLERLRKPQPVSLGITSLEGLKNEEKAERILDALRRYESYRRRGKGAKALTESYCVIRFGPDKQRLFYCGFLPYAFPAGEQSGEFQRNYRSNLEDLKRKIKEKHQILGNFGWGNGYTAAERFVLLPFAIGDSGTYYVFDVFHTYRADKLATLLAKSFDLTLATEVEIYQGALGFSELNGQMEYCFDEEELRKSMYSPDVTDTDIFVRFTRTERMMELARWLDGILAGMDIEQPLFRLDELRENVYALSLWNRTPSGKVSLMGESPRLIWKLRGTDLSREDMIQELHGQLHWYVDCGACGGKLKECGEEYPVELYLRTGSVLREDADN